MGLLKSSIVIQLFILFSVFCVPAIAEKKAYIVYLGAHSHGPGTTQADLDAVSDSHYQFLGSFLGSLEKAKESIFVSYKRNINGFAALLDEKEAAEIAKLPRVVSVFLNKVKQLHTTRSWGFLMLEDNDGVVLPGSLWEKAKFGEDTIIGNLDTGVWPTSESFSDNGYGPIPSRWKGICQNSTEGFPCNKKLIGARYFSKGRELSGKLNATEKTPMDHEGHGTHTLSTAGGNFVYNASIQGVGNGTAKGGSPRARVAMYKVCWPTKDGSGGCFDSDILEAFEAAIHDGVDVISASLGGAPSDYFSDGISIGAFHAAKKGIVVVCSAGNSGPDPGTVSNVSPWMITVAASSFDRNFLAIVELGHGLRFRGSSLSPALPIKKFFPLISAEQAAKAGANKTEALLCKENTLDRAKVKGKIVACLRGETARVDKGLQVLRAGAVGMILCNDAPNANDIVADLHLLPASHVTYKDGRSIFTYIKSTNNSKALLSPPIGEINSKPAPVMASFSSVGPNIVTPNILKPDITAPGVNVVAAYTRLVSPTELDFDKRRIPFNTMSGTSMSCPHVAGVVGLLKTLHRNWSPAAIRSAIVTTARTRDNTKHPMTDAVHVDATPFNYGNGHIRPNRAMDPGLVYDLATKDYLNLLCALGYDGTTVQLFSENPYSCPKKKVSVLDFNYPSFTVANLTGSVTLTRTVKNVGPAGVYAVKFVAPTGVSMAVEPKSLKFGRVGEEKSFNVTLKEKGHGLKGYRFGRLSWSDGKRHVRSPVVVQTT